MPNGLMEQRIAIKYSTISGMPIASTTENPSSCCICSAGPPGPRHDPPVIPCDLCVPNQPCEFGKAPCIQGAKTGTCQGSLQNRTCIYETIGTGNSAVTSSYFDDFMEFQGISGKSTSFDHHYTNTIAVRRQAPLCGSGMGLAKIEDVPDPPPFNGISFTQQSNISITIDDCRTFDPVDPFLAAAPRVYQPPDPNPGFATSPVPPAQKIRSLVSFGVQSTTRFRIFENGAQKFSLGMTRYNLFGAYDMISRHVAWALEYGPNGKAFQVGAGPPVCCGKWEGNASIIPITGHGSCSPGFNFGVSASWNVESLLGGRAGGFSSWGEGAMSGVGFMRLNFQGCEEEPGECLTCGGVREGVLL